MTTIGFDVACGEGNVEEGDEGAMAGAGLAAVGDVPGLALGDGDGVAWGVIA